MVAFEDALGLPDEEPFGEEDFEEEQDEADVIVEEGDLVLTHSWDSESPGSGAGAVSVYTMAGRYAVHDFEVGNEGPFDSLAEAMQAMDVGIINMSSTDIDADGMTADQLLPLFGVEVDEGFVLYINNDPWVWSEAEDFTPGPVSMRS
jgi:hypothetical protein